MSLLTQILSGYWAISPDAAKGFLPVVANLLTGKTLPFSDKKDLIEKRGEGLVLQSAVPLEVGSFFYGFNSENKSDRIGIIPLQGVMIKEDDLSTWGTDRVYELMKQAGENDGILATALMINSPGGAANSAENLFNLAQNYRSAYGKPIISIVDGLAASGAYWVASGTEKIFFIGNGVAGGSIGAMATIMDFTAYFESLGIKEIVIKATKSEDKNKAYDDAVAGDPAALRKEILDKIQSAFQKSVIKGRGGKITSDSETLTGKVYYGKDAIKAGLADDILDKESALDYAFRIGMAAKRKRS